MNESTEPSVPPMMGAELVCVVNKAICACPLSNKGPWMPQQHPVSIHGSMQLSLGCAHRTCMPVSKLIQAASKHSLYLNLRVLSVRGSEPLLPLDESPGLLPSAAWNLHIYSVVHEEPSCFFFLFLFPSMYGSCQTILLKCLIPGAEHLLPNTVP